MKILHLANIDELNPNVGLRDALASFAESGGYKETKSISDKSPYREIDWRKLIESGGRKALRSKFFELSADLGPTDLVFAQIQGENPIDDARMRACKAFKVHACWDIRNNTPNWAFDMGKQFDLMLFNNQRDIDNLNAVGSKAAFLQVGFCPEVFHPHGPKRPNTPPIVFLGSNYNSFPGSKFRAEMVMALQKRYGKDFGVFGRNWGTDVPFLKQEEEAACYRACKIAVSQSHAGVAGYTSDRLYRAMGCGALTMTQRTKGVTDSFADFTTWDTIDQLFNNIDKWLSDDAGRINGAEFSCSQTHKFHAWLPRFTQFFEMLPRLGGPIPHGIILDDPGYDPSKETEAKKWMDETVKNRLDGNTEKIVNIQSRVHEQDSTIQLESPTNLKPLVLPPPNWHFDLSKYAKRVHSQNGEDGIIARIFECIGTKNKFFVDIGAGDGVTLSNTACLREAGWNGFLVESDTQKMFLGNIAIAGGKATSENICDMIGGNGIYGAYPRAMKDFDFLSLDIDGQDYHVLKAILDGGFRPRVICVEFNGTKPAWPAITVPRYDYFAWDGTDYYGASAGAFYELMGKFKYGLIHMESKTNLFFVREFNPIVMKDILMTDFQPQQYHRRDERNRPWISLK